MITQKQARRDYKRMNSHLSFRKWARSYFWDSCEEYSPKLAQILKG